MSFRASHWAAHEVRGLRPVERIILLILAEYADDRDCAWPSQERLAEEVETSVSTLRRSLSRMEELGLLTREHRWVMDGSGDTHRASNVYQLHVGHLGPGGGHDGRPRGTGPSDTPIPVRMTGMREPGTKVPVDSSSGEPSEERLFVANTDTGQNDRYEGATRPYRSNRGGIPVTQVTGISTPNHQLEPPDLTGPGEDPSPGDPTPVRVGSGREEALAGGAAPGSVPGRARPDASGAPPGGGRPAPSARSGTRSGGVADGLAGHTSGPSGDHPGAGTTPESLSEAPGTAEQGSGVQPEEGSGHERPSESLSGPRGLVAACLPGHMQALDAEGARQVAILLRQRLDAGWQPADIRRLMDQGLPPEVYRLSSLVAARLRANVDPALAPVRATTVTDAHSARQAEVRRQEAARRRSEELAGTVRERHRDPGAESAEAAAWERARREAPGASRLRLAQRVNEILAEDGAGGAGSRGRGGRRSGRGRGRRARRRRVS